MKKTKKIENKILYSHARVALFYGLYHLHIEEGSNILLPDYICDVVPSTLDRFGIIPKYYKINDNFEPNWIHVNSIIDKSTTAIMMVHFFGNPQDISSFKSFCKEKKIYLIEDYAHGYGGKIKGKTLGTFGDIGISSPRKILNTETGGILYINGQISYANKKLKRYNVSTIKKIKKFLLNNLKIKIFLKTFIGRPNYENPLEFVDLNIYNFSSDKHSQFIFDNCKWEKIRNTKKECYSMLEDFALRNGLKPAFNKLSKNSIPWCMPAYVKNQKEAIRWFDWGWKNNIKIFSWPTLPLEIISNRKKTYDRWKRLVCFEINDQLLSNKKIIDIIKHSKNLN